MCALVNANQTMSNDLFRAESLKNIKREWKQPDSDTSTKNSIHCWEARTRQIEVCTLENAEDVIGVFCTSLLNRCKLGVSSSETAAILAQVASPSDQHGFSLKQNERCT